MTRWSGRLAPALAILALTAGCSAAASSSGPNPHRVAPGPALTQLIHRADLLPCPRTTPNLSAVADGLPGETLPCIGRGPAVDLADLRGQPSVVNLYGTWCGDCGKEAGFLSTAAAADRGKVRFLGVDIDDTAPSALSYAAATRPAAHYPLVADSSDTVIHAYSPGPPATLFVDAAGSVVHVQRGAFTSTAQLQAAIKTYLRVG